MSSLRQKKLARAIVKSVEKGGEETAKELLVKVGYAINTAEAKPGETMAQKGVLEELSKLGFNEDNAKRVVAEILNTGEEQNRLKAADMVFKVNSTYAPEKQVTLNLKGDVKDFAKYQSLNEDYDKKLLEMYQNE